MEISDVRRAAYLRLYKLYTYIEPRNPLGKGLLPFDVLIFARKIFACQKS